MEVDPKFKFQPELHENKYSGYKRTIVDLVANFCSLGAPLQFYYPDINTNSKTQPSLPRSELKVVR